MTARSPHHTGSVFRPTAAILAWLWPGLGHISLGERRRGMLIMLGVLFLFLSGLLVGGVDCVDMKNDRLWFLAQGLCGPIAFGADFLDQALVQRPLDDWSEGGELRRLYDRRDPGLIASLRRVGLGKVNEAGTLFVALAGLMNLVVILDALYAPAPRAGEDRA